jgi:hypothetical protein
MSEEQKVLTKEIAEEFIKDDASVELEQFESIDDAAAEVLGSYQPEVSDGLLLSGLLNLSDLAAENLAKAKCDIDLSGLTTLTDTAAACLSKHTGKLDLSGLAKLSPQAAKSLGAHPGQVLLEGAACEAMRSLLGNPEHSVDIGIVVSEPPRFKGVSCFKIRWSLLETPFEIAGENIDWASAEVTYDLETGRAWSLGIRQDFIERGLAQPYLEGPIRVASPFEDDTTVYEEDLLESEIQFGTDFSQCDFVEIIGRIHAHALEFFKKS